MAEIWEGKWVKSTDSEVFVFWVHVSISGLVLVVKHPPKIGLNQDSYYSGMSQSVLIHAVLSQFASFPRKPGDILMHRSK